MHYAQFARNKAHIFCLDGIELLCLIDMRMDACKYLISHGKWSDAIWLAKTSLNQQERTLVIKRWAEQLLNTNRMV
ncbi:hypothetical protein DPMN_168809 [Dreissena polymorpha]|uniref:WDR11 TPR domain-containing protein n=1 Tax=Dreissena polymorpha TaxID=45954 RepID=A0A9D4F692_DREPO|nr:hypothetical protein DPMN_168809 [Dreissena polymorpha]